MRGNNPQVSAVVNEIVTARPDIIALQRFDWDQKSQAATAFQAALKSAGWSMEYLFAPRPNSGLQSGIDLNGDGRIGRYADAQGYGKFAGSRGLLLLSRYPFDVENLQNYSDLIWNDLPNTRSTDRSVAAEVQRLSSVAHIQIPIQVGQKVVTLMTFHATAPVFDGPDDRNGRRNADEITFWIDQLPQISGPFVLLGNANLDPDDGEGIKSAITQLLSNPKIVDPKPTSRGAIATANPNHRGNPELDTVNWPEEGPGNLRVSYVLPSRDLSIVASGVNWPETQTDLASRHRLVWVDVTLP